MELLVGKFMFLHTLGERQEHSSLKENKKKERNKTKNPTACYANKDWRNTNSIDFSRKKKMKQLLLFPPSLLQKVWNSGNGYQWCLFHWGGTVLILSEIISKRNPCKIFLLFGGRKHSPPEINVEELGTTENSIPELQVFQSLFALAYPCHSFLSFFRSVKWVACWYLFCGLC